MLLIFDLGFLNFSRFDHLTEAGVFFVTRIQERNSYRVGQIVQANERLHDVIVWVGSGKDSQCAHSLRLVEWQHNGN